MVPSEWSGMISTPFVGLKIKSCVSPDGLGLKESCDVRLVTVKVESEFGGRMMDVGVVRG
jgi:hypothetical protein